MTYEIETYTNLPVGYRNWDPEAPVIAQTLIQMILSMEARLHVEHIGSTSIPGCGGKGYIDLLVIYDDGQLDVAKGVLKDLGFQRQTSRDPFPESRPMRVGSVMHKGRWYRINVHVVAHDSPEVRALVGFRDRLRSDAALRVAYEAEKERILASGVRDGVEYAKCKTEFIRGVTGDEAQR